ncbi:MAG: MFS transporter [Planctomycetaceae bacterium]|nr:MFS transporter [Planctomycetaceae bacterium]
MADHSNKETAGRTGVLIGICGCHLLHDGLADTLYVFLPIWQKQFALSYAEVGLVVTLYFGALATFQLPAALLAERVGERRLLVVGTTALGLGFLVLGWVGGFAGLLVVVFLTGLGSTVQHPLGAALVARAYAGEGRRVAIGTYNFSGDLGKAFFPTVAGLALLSVGWTVVTSGLGMVAVSMAALFLVASGKWRIDTLETRSGSAVERQGEQVHNPRGFAVLSSIGMIDSLTRYGLLTLLPFLLISRGYTASSAGMALGLLFAGGAVGKFLCGFLAQRIGVLATVWLTEIMTSGGIIALLLVPPGALVVLLPLVGAALNGTSTVLYGSVADFVSPQRRTRAFGVFYTIVIAAGALAPPTFGVVSDRTSVESSLTVVALVALATLPLASLLKRCESAVMVLPRRPGG